MKDITKALQDLKRAVESDETVKNVKITITLQKPKKASKLSKAGGGQKCPSRKSYCIIY